MAMANDEILELKIKELREVIDELPHAIAKKIEASLGYVIDEAHWVNTQRDRARQELAALKAKREEDPENLILQISIILEDPASTYEAVEEVKLLISDHWGFIETDEDQDQVDALKAELNADIEREAAIHRRAGE